MQKEHGEKVGMKYEGNSSGNSRVSKKKRKKVTQDELASYLGVSKAAISKWETGQSYPDITLLPRLAVYFNISIDELLGYSPQLERGEIRSIYRNFCQEFTREPFEDVYKKCQELIARYYSCYSFLLQMGILLLNHSGMAEGEERIHEVIEDDRLLFERINKECDNISIVKQALCLEGYCYLMQGRPEEALTLLEDMEINHLNTDEILAQAYYMMGNSTKAKEKNQMDLYNNIVNIFGAFPMLFELNRKDPEKLDECVRRAMEFDRIFAVREFHPAIVLSTCLSAATTYASAGNREKTLETLEEYTKMAVSGIFPFKLHGDSFFDQIDSVLDNLDLGDMMVRSEETVRQSIRDGVIRNAAFVPYENEPRYKALAGKLKNI